MGRKLCVLAEFDPVALMNETFDRDPGEVQVLDMIKKLNETLEDVSELTVASRERIMDALQNIAERWPLFGKEVVVSGWVNVAQRGIADEYSHEKSVITRLDGVNVVSYGFDLVEISPENEYEDGEAYITHLVGFDTDQKSEIIKPDTSKYPMFVGRGKLDDVIMKCALDEHYDLREYLEKYYPEETDAIVGCFVEADNEIEVLENLRDVVINTSGVQDPDELNENLSKYMSRELVFDKFIPYSAIFKGSILAMNEEGSVIDESAFVTEWQNVLMYPIQAQFLPKLVEDENEVLVASRESSVPYLIAKMARFEDVVEKNEPVVFAYAAIPLSDQFILQSNSKNLQEVIVDQE